MPRVGRDDPPSKYELHTGEAVLLRAKTQKPLVDLRKKVLESMVTSRIQSQVGNAQLALSILSRGAEPSRLLAMPSVAVASASVASISSSLNLRTVTREELSHVLFAMVRLNSQ